MIKYQTNKTKKAKQTKNLRHSEKDLGVVPRDYQKEVPECVLYLWSNGPWRFELANKSSLAEGFSWCIPQIRLTSPTTLLLSLQHKSGRKWRSVLRKDVKGNRPRKNGRASKRQASAS